MLIEMQSWLLQPKVCRFVCFVSSVVGLVCYALSSSFNHLFGKWSWWKILLYIVFAFIICLAVLFTKASEWFTSLRLEAHAAFLILMITSVYSFFVDKVIKGKPDTYSLFSCASFAIMSLGLSRLNHFGFEVDLLYFFSGLLTVQLMKIKLWLVVLGGSFSYSLIILRSNWHDDLILHDDLELQAIDQDIESASLSFRTNSNASSLMDSTLAITIGIGYTNPQTDAPLENENIGLLVTQMSSHSQQGRSSDSNSDDTSAERFQSAINSCTVIQKRIGEPLIGRFMARIEALKKKNGSVISTISKHVDECLQANVIVDHDQIPVPHLHHDDNLVLDTLGFHDDVGYLSHTAWLMVSAGIKEEWCRAYCSWRREFLTEALSKFGLQVQDLNMEDIDKMEKIQCWIKALNVAVKILFPNERRLFDTLFGRFFSSDFAFAEICTESATHLLSIANALPKVIPNTLAQLMCDFEILFSGEYCKSLRKDAREVLKSLGILMDSESLLTYGGGRLLAVTHELIDFVRNNSVGTQFNLKLSSEGMVSPVQVTTMTRLFERSLKASSKNYKNPALGYVFVLNNRSYIAQDAALERMGDIGYSWLQKNKRKIEKYIQLYQRSSWTKILNILKLDINESEPDVAAELMKGKLRSFNEHFDDICNDQATWFVISAWLRKQIIQSIENILLPAYGNFIGRLQGFLGSHAYKYIKYGIFDVKDRVNNLFLVRE